MSCGKPNLKCDCFEECGKYLNNDFGDWYGYEYSNGYDVIPSNESLDIVGQS